jgi:hypothetical protein
MTPKSKPEPKPDPRTEQDWADIETRLAAGKTFCVNCHATRASFTAGTVPPARVISPCCAPPGTYNPKVTEGGSGPVPPGEYRKVGKHYVYGMTPEEVAHHNRRPTPVTGSAFKDDPNPRIVRSQPAADKPTPKYVEPPFVGGSRGLSPEELAHHNRRPTPVTGSAFKDDPNPRIVRQDLEPVREPEAREPEPQDLEPERELSAQDVIDWLERMGYEMPEEAGWDSVQWKKLL